MFLYDKILLIFMKYLAMSNWVARDKDKIRYKKKNS